MKDKLAYTNNFLISYSYLKKLGLLGHMLLSPVGKHSTPLRQTPTRLLDQRKVTGDDRPYRRCWLKDQLPPECMERYELHVTIVTTSNSS